MMVDEGTLLWEPSAERQSASNMARYMAWLRDRHGLSFDGYHDLWRWSVTQLGAFWESIWQHFEIASDTPYTTPLAHHGMPGAEWFPGATVNYARQALRRRDDHLALIYRSEAGDEERLTRAQLAERVARAAAGLRRLGVGRGDRVVSFLPNCPETLVAFLAAASLGAIWSSCSPDFGVASVLDRFQQIEPKVLFAVDGYPYNGRWFDRREAAAHVRDGLPTLAATVTVARREWSGEGLVAWDDLLAESSELSFEAVPFDHPLWVLYSSGTTGLPKPIVQGHGGILLEHYKELSLQCDLTPDDRFFWFTTTGWMMWNFLIGGLLVDSTILLYEGAPAHPDLNALWGFADDVDMTFFGTSAPYLTACMREGLRPGDDFDLSAIRAVGSTGAPLPPEGFGWVYEAVGRDLLLGSVSGGTDVCTAFVGCCPLLPVHAGEIQCSQLGAKVEAFDPQGRPIVDEVGELVLTEPMPSMPIGFWNDPDGERLHESYFAYFPGVWRHGDWVRFTERGSCIIYGRSDATLNRGGVRMGTSEFYRVVEALPEVADSLVVDTGEQGQGQLWLFLVLRDDTVLDDALRNRVRQRLREALSPRHVPDHLLQVPAIPRTLSNKKSEVPIKKILTGERPDAALNKDALANPQALEAFVELARNLPRTG